MISALNKLQDGTIELTITIPWQKISRSYRQKLTELGKSTMVKGFRKGKAPIKMIEKKIGKQRLYEEVLKDLITDVYLEAVKEHNLKPIVNPQISVGALEENKDWQIKATTCELPKVELDNYKEAVKKSLASEKIWLPGQDKKDSTPESENKKLEKIFQALLSSTKVSIPEILIQEETNRMLSRLIDQTSKLGITLEQYLASSGKTAEQLKSEYRQQAEQTIKLELILSAIADKEEIKISEAEVEKMIENLPDPESRQSFKTPKQKAYIRQLLRKRQVIDNLAKL